MVPLAGGKPARVNDVYSYLPVASPDGQSIAYVTWSPEGGHIMKARASGGAQPQQLTQMQATYQEPAFSPDGQRIVFRRGDDGRLRIIVHKSALPTPAPQ